jgi:haloalkane dehalogenase
VQRTNPLPPPGGDRLVNHELDGCASRRFRSPGGEDMILRDNVFVEQVLPGAVMRQLTDSPTPKWIIIASRL